MLYNTLSNPQLTYMVSTMSDFSHQACSVLGGETLAGCSQQYSVQFLQIILQWTSHLFFTRGIPFAQTQSLLSLGKCYCQTHKKIVLWWQCPVTNLVNLEITCTYFFAHQPIDWLKVGRISVDQEFFWLQPSRLKCFGPLTLEKISMLITLFN